MEPFEVPPVPYPELLDRAVERHGDKVALVFEGRQWSYRELQRLTWQAAHFLQRHGVGAGDRVALGLYNGPEFIAAFYGTLRLGAVVVPLNASYREDEVRHILHDAGPVQVIAADRLRETVPDVEVLAGQTFLSDIEQQPAHSLQPPHLDPATTLAVLQYSSGTTGRTKGVMLSHRNIVASHLQYLRAGQVTEQDVSLLFVPMVHVYGLMLMGGALATGATLVVMPRYNLIRSLELVEQYRVTLYYCTTTVVTEMVDSPEARRFDLSSIRYINAGGAPMSRDVVRRAREELRIPVASGYGLSEAPISGHLVPGEERRIVDPDDPTRDMPAGEPGEIWIRGPQVMMGYWNDPEATRAVLHNGWLRTGDIGRIDERGRLIITARMKEMIKFRGFAVSPTELEGLLMSHPSVADCAVVGRQQPDGNELPKAFIVLREGGSAEEAVAYVNSKVADYKHIRELQVVSGIPRNEAGKILKRLLQ